MVRREDPPRIPVRLLCVFFVSSGVLESTRRGRKAQKAQRIRKESI
jgi:hypothetical protein